MQFLLHSQFQFCTDICQNFLIVGTDYFRIISHFFFIMPQSSLRDRHASLLSQSETKLLHFYSAIFSLQTVFLKLEAFIIYRIFRPVFIAMKYAYKNLDILLNCLNGIIGKSTLYTFFTYNYSILKNVSVRIPQRQKPMSRDSRLYDKDKKLD